MRTIWLALSAININFVLILKTGMNIRSSDIRCKGRGCYGDISVGRNSSRAAFFDTNGWEKSENAAALLVFWLFQSGLHSIIGEKKEAIV